MKIQQADFKHCLLNNSVFDYSVFDQWTNASVHCLRDSFFCHLWFQGWESTNLCATGVSDLPAGGNSPRSGGRFLTACAHSLKVLLHKRPRQQLRASHYHCPVFLQQSQHCFSAPFQTSSGDPTRHWNVFVVQKWTNVIQVKHWYLLILLWTLQTQVCKITEFLVSKCLLINCFMISAVIGHCTKPNGVGKLTCV